MVFTKRFPGFFAKFVLMKRSTRFLLPKKRQDLQQLTSLILEQVKQVEMIVLFGSYAKNSYVDYDQRVEFGTPTYYMSDYDIVILTRKPIGAAEYSLYEKIKDKFFENKNRPFHTHPQFINYGIDDFNYAIEKAHYFETEIKRDGVVLFDSGAYKLARRRKLDYTEIRDRALSYYNEKLACVDDFVIACNSLYKLNRNKRASFQLHQSVENLLRVIPMVFTLYGHKSHNLSELMNAAKKHTTEIFRVFPRDTQEEQRLFDLLQRAYIESRYNPDFEITKEDIDALIPKVEQLRSIVERTCRDRIAYYDAQITE